MANGMTSDKLEKTADEILDTLAAYWRQINDSGHWAAGPFVARQSTVSIRMLVRTLIHARVCSAQIVNACVSRNWLLGC